MGTRSIEHEGALFLDALEGRPVDHRTVRRHEPRLQVPIETGDPLRGFPGGGERTREESREPEHEPRGRSKSPPATPAANDGPERFGLHSGNSGRNPTGESSVCSLAQDEVGHPSPAHRHGEARGVPLAPRAEADAVVGLAVEEAGLERLWSYLAELSRDSGDWSGEEDALVEM